MMVFCVPSVLATSPFGSSLGKKRRYFITREFVELCTSLQAFPKCARWGFKRFLVHRSMLKAMGSTDRESDLSLTVLSSMLAWSHTRSRICSLSGWVCRSATTLTETVSICSVSLTQNISQQVPWAFKNSLILFLTVFFVHNYYLWTAFNHISSNLICVTHICFNLILNNICLKECSKKRPTEMFVNASVYMNDVQSVYVWQLDISVGLQMKSTIIL